MFVIGFPAADELDGGNGYARYIYIGTWICGLALVILQVLGLVVSNMKRLFGAVYSAVGFWYPFYLFIFAVIFEQL